MDTSNHILKRQNQSSAWVSLRKDDGTVLIPDGSAGSPSIQPSDDGNTGIYSAGADQLNVSTNGVARLNISTTAVASTLPITTIDGTAAAPAWSLSDDTDTGVYSANANELNFTTGGTRRVSLDSSSLSVVPNIVLENQADIRLSEASSNGSHYVAIQSAAALASNFTLTLPDNDGGANEVLKSDGSGNLSWTDTVANATTSAACSGNAATATTATGATWAGGTHTSSGTNERTAAQLFQGVPKAWVKFNGTGTVSVTNDFNVSSITDHATGDWSVNFGSTMANANYCVMCCSNSDGPTGPSNWGFICVTQVKGTPTTSAVRICRGHEDTNDNDYDLVDTSMMFVTICDG